MRRLSIPLAVLVVVLVSGAVPAAAAGPTITNVHASNVWADTAVLNGNVDSGGAPLTSCTFRYGPALTYPNGAQSLPCQYSAGTTGVYAVPTHLVPNTSYEFDLSASDAGGSAAPVSSSFKTSMTFPPAPTASTQPATAVTATSAELNGNVDPKYAPVTNCYFEYGPTTGYGNYEPCSPSPQSAGPQSLSAGVSGLTKSHTYHFQIVISTEGGTARGGDQSFTTSASGGGGSGGSSKGSATTGQPSAVSATSAVLHGTVNPHGGSGDACTFYYGTGTGYQSSVPCSDRLPTGHSAIQERARVSGLRPHTSYHYAIVLSTSNGPADGKAVTFRTLTLPRAATGRTTRVRRHAATLHARVNAEGARLIACRFQFSRHRSHVAAGTHVRSAACVPRPGGSHFQAVRNRIRHLTPHRTYYYRVWIRTQAGTAVGRIRRFRTR
jgi:hypothetical protein